MEMRGASLGTALSERRNSVKDPKLLPINALIVIDDLLRLNGRLSGQNSPLRLTHPVSSHSVYPRVEGEHDHPSRKKKLSSLELIVNVGRNPRDLQIWLNTRAFEAFPVPC